MSLDTVLTSTIKNTCCRKEDGIRYKSFIMSDTLILINHRWYSSVLLIYKFLKLWKCYHKSVFLIEILSDIKRYKTLTSASSFFSLFYSIHLVVLELKKEIPTYAASKDKEVLTSRRLTRAKQPQIDHLGATFRQKAVLTSRSQVSAGNRFATKRHRR